MESGLLSTVVTPLKFSPKPTSILPCNWPTVSCFRSFTANLDSFKGLRNGLCRVASFKAMPTRTLLCTKAVLSEVPNQQQFFKVGAESTGPIPSKQLMQVVQSAAETGAKVWPLSVSSLFLRVICLCELNLYSIYY